MFEGMWMVEERGIWEGKKDNDTVFTDKRMTSGLSKLMGDLR